MTLPTDAWWHWCGTLNEGRHDPDDVEAAFCRGCRSEVTKPLDHEVTCFVLTVREPMALPYDEPLPLKRIDWWERTQEFHAKHPEVYAWIVAECRRLWEEGSRWEQMFLLVQRARRVLKVPINSNYARSYALMFTRDHEQEMPGLFRFREGYQRGAA